MNRTLLFIVAVAVILPCALRIQTAAQNAKLAQSQSQSLVGAWNLTEVEISGGPYAGRHTSDVQPGRFIATSKEYALMWVQGFTPRALLETGSTDAERAKVWAAFTANAGSYELKGSTLTLTPVVAKNPSSMHKDSRITYDLRLEGNALWFIWKTSGYEYRAKFVRIE